jgi:nucleoside-diphosphate-sugar epimerase
VLVTGATGFIGSHLASRLAEYGAEVHAVSRSRPDGAVADAYHWHRVDLRELDEASDVVRAARPDLIFHLASEVTGAREVKLVVPTMKANLMSAVNLLTAAADEPATRVVLAGSIEEPRRGDPTPSSPYAVAKWAATSYARLFYNLWDVQVTVLRVAMVYGPGQRDTTKLVPYTALSLLRGHRPRVSSGTRLIDWVYVDDVVDAFVAAVTPPAAQRVTGQTIDIGSGQAVSIREVTEQLARVAGSPLRPRYGAIPDRPLDFARIADLGPATELLGWRPSVGLEEGLRRTVSWYAAHRD